MENKEQVMNSFKAALSIVERTLSGLEVPFKIIEILDNEKGPHAKVNIDGKVFFMAPNTTGTKLWIANFPIKNTEGTNVPPGYIGFSTDVAGIIRKYYEEKPKGTSQTFDGVGTIHLNEVIKEEVRKVFEGDYDYAAAEREYADKGYYEQDMEAEISTALSFMQDVKGSVNKLETQKDLKSTNPEVDGHLEEAITHLNQSIQSYLSSLDSDVKTTVLDRLGEINIDK